MAVAGLVELLIDDCLDAVRLGVVGNPSDRREVFGGAEGERDEERNQDQGYEQACPRVAHDDVTPAGKRSDRMRLLRCAVPVHRWWLRAWLAASCVEG